MVNFSHMIAEHCIQNPTVIQQINSLILRLKDKKWSDNLSAYQTKVIACGLSKFYFGHIGSLINSKTEKRQIVCDVSLIIARILYCQKYKDDTGATGILTCGDAIIKEFMMNFYTTLGIPEFLV